MGEARPPVPPHVSPPATLPQARMLMVPHACESSPRRRTRGRLLPSALREAGTRGGVSSWHEAGRRGQGTGSVRREPKDPAGPRVLSEAGVTRGVGRAAQEP